MSEILIRLAQGISGFQSGMVFNYVLIVVLCSFNNLFDGVLKRSKIIRSWELLGILA